MSEIPEQLGLVISYFGNSVAVEAADGQVFPCHLRRNQTLPVVGDEVHWHLEKDNTGLIKDILPRRTTLARGDGHGNMKVIAANIDIIVIVMAPLPVFSAALVDRYLIASEVLGIEAVLAVNKIDLLSEAEKQKTEQYLQVYRGVPYSVLLTSAKTDEGLDQLAAHLQNKVSVLVGPSGVGKSSIIADLVQQDIRVNEVSPKGAGKHTTTATRLYHLPNGGKLIDSPGVRDFTLWPVTKQEVLCGFKEFHAYLTGCKFRDCIHTVEPGCAVQKAVADGKIAPERFACYQAFMKEAIK
jgi:ribosome biogenesis GTPase